MRLRNLCLLVMMSSTACSRDPSKEAPVTLQPGLYEVTLGGSTLLNLKTTDERREQVCLDADAISQFSSDPLGPLVEKWDNCSTESDEPRGNAFSGKRDCPERKMPMTASYTGRHATDSFQIDGTISQGTGETSSVMQLGSGEFSLTGTRVGDCPA